MSLGLREKTIHGLFWSFFDRTGQQLIQLVFSIIIARLLLPKQFGLIAMLAVFMAIGQSLVESGFGQALVQKQDAKQIDESSIFYFNILIGIFVFTLMYFAAPWISSFYGEPILVSLTRVLALNLIINSFGIVQLSLLTKRVDFKTQMRISMFAALLSGSIGLSMAYIGFGVWSLVAQAIGNTTARTSLVWFYNKWRPTLAFSITSLKTMFPFGSRLLFYGLIQVIFDNLYLIVIGKIFRADALGLYSKSRNLQQLPVGILTSTINRVTFPVFSSIQEDKLRLKRGLRKGVGITALFNFPAMTGLCAVSYPLIFVLLTEKWLPCVPYLQLLCGVGLLYPLYSINLNVLVAQGRSDLLLRLEILSRILQVLAILSTFRWGIIALILGHLATSIINFSLSTVYTGKILYYPLWEQIQDVAPYFIAAVLMGVSVWSIGLIKFPNLFLQLILQVLTGIFLYILICRLAKLPSFMEMQEIIKLGFARILRKE
jgi:O-antigen/teichoic acid export membrane protein